MLDDEPELLLILAFFTGVAISAIPSSFGMLVASLLAVTGLIILGHRRTIRAALKTWIVNGREVKHQ